MGRIKSAWEIALEKTQDIEIDEEKYRQETLLKEGMSLAGKYLNNPEMSYEQLEKDYSEGKKTGVVRTIFSNLGLPQDNSYKMRFERLCEVVNLVDVTGRAGQVMQQTGQFFEQYLQAREDFANRMQEELRMQMEQNPETVNSAQYAKLI